MTRKEIYETELPHRAVAVYLYLETRADRERTCYPAIGTIARELHLSVSTVKRAIRDLECAGLCTLASGRGVILSIMLQGKVILVSSCT